MRSKVQEVRFGQLNEDHKAEFMEFLVKNNICFQKGKENCVAKVTIKNGPTTRSTNPDPPQTHRRSLPKYRKKEPALATPVKSPLNTLYPQTPSKPNNNDNDRRTPLKSADNRLNLSPHKSHKSAEKSNKSAEKSNKKSVDRSEEKGRDRNGEKGRERSGTKIRKYKEQLKGKKEQMRIQERCKSVKKPEERQKLSSKYGGVFAYDFSKQRPIRWPISQLERILEDIYDEIFTKNSLYLQNKSYGSALKVLSQSNFEQLVEQHFQNKFKASKLIVCNLHNMVYSLSCHLLKEPSALLSTFEGFLVHRYDAQDLVFYLFMRSLAKKTTSGGSHMLQHREIKRFLKDLVGNDQQLMREYWNVLNLKEDSASLELYSLLLILLQDYHSKKAEADGPCDSVGSLGNTIHANIRIGNPEVREVDRLRILQREEDSQRQQLTFGDETMPHGFWENQEYKETEGQLLSQIGVRLSGKVNDLLRILFEGERRWVTEDQLVRKAECLVKSLLQMDKAKWFRELQIESPLEDDICLVERMQLRIKQLQNNPTSKAIGDFCKEILTIKELLAQLEQSI